MKKVECAGQQEKHGQDLLQNPVFDQGVRSVWTAVADYEGFFEPELERNQFIQKDNSTFWMDEELSGPFLSLVCGDQDAGNGWKAWRTADLDAKRELLANRLRKFVEGEIALESNTVRHTWHD